MDMKYIFAAVVLAVFAGVGFMLFSGNSYASHAIDSSIPAGTGENYTGNQQDLQVISLRALSTGLYDHSTLTVKAGQPVRLDFTAEPGSGCGAQLILDGVGTNVNLISRNGQTVSATFTPPAPGQYRYHCGMNMFRGVLIAT